MRVPREREERVARVREAHPALFARIRSNVTAAPGVDADMQAAHVTEVVARCRMTTDRRNQ